jgi:amino acid transporter
MKYPAERSLSYAWGIVLLIAFVLIAVTIGLKILFPEWGLIPKIILLCVIVVTLIVAIALIIYRRKKYVKKML